jgi:hypothetical protein
MTIFAGFVTMLKMAIVVNAVSVSNLRPCTPAIAAKMTNVATGENIPRALATLKLAYSRTHEGTSVHHKPEAL